MSLRQAAEIDDTKVKPKEEAEEEALPSFGSSLNKYLATPPSTHKRETRSSTRLYNSSSVRAERKIAYSHTSSPSTCTLGEMTPPTSPSTSALGKRSSSSKTGSTKKRKKVYEADAFEGMAEVPDRIAEDLNILFCGCNPGVRSSQEGYHYAHPSNRFYRVLHDSGLTPHKLKPSESPEMPEKYSMGLTDLGRRCTARADQVPSMEFQAGAVAVLAKMMRWRPKIVCFIGMDVYRNFRKHFPSHLVGLPKKATKRSKTEPDTSPQDPSSLPESPSPSSTGKGKGKQSTSDVQLGLQKLVISVLGKQDGPWRHLVRLFVIPSTSGLAAGYTDTDRVAYLCELKEVVEQLVQGIHTDPADTSILRAEDYMESRIAKTESGDWAYIEKGGLETLTVKKEEA